MSKFKTVAIIFLFGVFLFSCNLQNVLAQTTQPGSQKTTVFPKGEKITNDNFTGNAWLQPMVTADSLNPVQVGNVTFEPGARTKWHLHPGG